MTTLSTYHARYAEILAEMQRDGIAAPCRAAWERVELELFTLRGERRYLTYESFRVMSARLRRRAKVNKITAVVALLT